jgi:hypothetical protein
MRILAALLLGLFLQAPDLQTELAWSCPVHAVVAEKNPGRCPICRRELVQVTVTVTWTCPDRPDIERPQPGKCADGSATEPKYTQSTHANHNPRHGGMFFMAPDLWHHLEGVYAQDGMFRVYLYDDYTKPLAADQAQLVNGRVVLKETFDAATRTTTELVAMPLKLSAGGEYLEARVGRVPLPAEMTAKLKFKGDTPEFRFDFAFPEFSVDRSLAPPPGELSQAQLEVPNRVGEILSLLSDRVRLIGDLVRKGAFGEVWVPAFQAKDLGLALDVRNRELPIQRRGRAASAVDRLVRAAWLLDAYGDLGNRTQVEGAYSAFSSASADVQAAFAELAVRETAK